MIMKVLVVLALLGVVYGDGVIGDKCGALELGTPDQLPQSNIVVVIKNSNDEAVDKVHEAHTLYVTTTIPNDYTASSVDCLLSLGRVHHWRRMMPLACKSAVIVEGGATCVFIVAHVNVSQDLMDERVDVRIGITHSRGYLRTNYGQNGRNPIYYRHEQKDEEPEAPEPTPSTVPFIVIEEDGIIDPHDSKQEAYLAAKWAEQQQHMADDEDRNSEGEWQKLMEEEKQKHEMDMKEEQEEYEAELAKEQHQHEERIREEMMDKEEHDHLEDEMQPKIPQVDMHKDSIEENKAEEGIIDFNEIPVGEAAGSHTYGLGAALVLVISTLMAAIVL